MFDTVIEMLSYPFMTRAFLVGSLVALCSALLGVSLVLKRYSMIGDGLSHVGFGAMAIAAAMNAAPLTIAIPVVIVAGDSASSNQRECKDQRRCGNCTDFYNVTSSWRDGDLIDNRNEYGCI